MFALTNSLCPRCAKRHNSPSALLWWDMTDVLMAAGAAGVAERPASQYWGATWDDWAVSTMVNAMISSCCLMLFHGPWLEVWSLGHWTQAPTEKNTVEERLLSCVSLNAASNQGWGFVMGYVKRPEMYQHSKCIDAAALVGSSSVRNAVQLRPVRPVRTFFLRFAGEDTRGEQFLQGLILFFGLPAVSGFWHVFEPI